MRFFLVMFNHRSGIADVCESVKTEHKSRKKVQHEYMNVNAIHCAEMIRILFEHALEANSGLLMV